MAVQWLTTAFERFELISGFKQGHQSGNLGGERIHIKRDTIVKPNEIRTIFFNVFTGQEKNEKLRRL